MPGRDFLSQVVQTVLVCHRVGLGGVARLSRRGPFAKLSGVDAAHVVGVLIRGRLFSLVAGCAFRGQVGVVVGGRWGFGAHPVGHVGVVQFESVGRRIDPGQLGEACVPRAVGRWWPPRSWP